MAQDYNARKLLIIYTVLQTKTLPRDTATDYGRAAAESMFGSTLRTGK